jgi:hypothetical protein
MRDYRGALVCAITIIWLLSPVYALTVQINPSDGSEVKTIYVDEVVPYTVKIYNDENIVLNILKLKVVTDEHTVIMDGLEEKRMVFFDVNRLAPRESREFTFEVKPLTMIETAPVPEEKRWIAVYYGKQDYTHLTSTYFKIAESPIKMEARLAKTVIGRGGENAVILSVENTSSRELRDVNAWLMLPQNYTLENGDWHVAVLEPEQSFGNKHFTFKAPASISGEQNVCIVLEFTDANTRHRQSRCFTFVVQEYNLGLIAVIALLVALIVLSLISKKKSSKIKEKWAARLESK